MLDEILKPCLSRVKSLVKESGDFVRQIKTMDTLTEEYTFITYDVESLYTNIPHALGKNAISFWVEKCVDIIPERFNKNLILEGLDLVLKNNTFLFNSIYYQQVSGTAMGTKVAPTYANLVLGFLEEILYQQMHDSYGAVHSEFVKQHFKRFLDDCFTPWLKSLGDPNNLTVILNNLHPNIRFTIETNESGISFLDTFVYKQDNQIYTDIYQKPTDSHNYVPFTSAHTRQTKTNIPYTLARRIQMLVDDSSIRQVRFAELKDTLLNKGYPAQVIDIGIKKAQSLDRNNLLDSRKNDKELAITFVTEYNPNSDRRLKPFIKSTYANMQQSTETREVFKDTKLTFAYKQPPNMKGLLTKAAFTEQDKSDNEKVYKCSPKCQSCKFLQEGNTHVFTGTKYEFKIKNSFTCTTRNVIYVMICGNCDKDYIGQSSLEIRFRIAVHKQQIKDPGLRKLHVSKHIFECGKGNFRIFPFFKMFTNDQQERLNKEEYFIQKFKPALNRDL